VIAWWIAIAVVVLVVLMGIVSYNRFISQRQLVTDSWRDIDVELQRRHDLIPNLVATVKGYAAHEKAVFEAVAAARATAIQAAGGSTADREKAETTVTQRLGGLLAVAEAYPDLKASANFQQLQHELTDTEDRLAAARRFYNGNVRDYNTRVQAFPSRLVASLRHFEEGQFFQIADASLTHPVAVDLPSTEGEQSGPDN
jgi:LemA protein